MLERIRSFLAVLEEGSVNKASRYLGVSQPTLSRHIQSLEQEIGGLLFDRGPKGMQATDLGFYLRDRFTPVLREYDVAVSEMHAFAQGRYYNIRVGYIGLAATKFLNPALSKLKREFPDLKLQLYDQTPGEQLKSIQDGKLDVAIVGQDIIHLADDFYQRRAVELGVCAVLPENHPLADKSAVLLSELENDLFVGVSPVVLPGRNQWIRHLCRQAGFTPRFFAETNDVSETYTLVVSEGAVALLPNYLEGAPPPGVVHRPLSDNWAKWQLYVLRQRGRGSDATKRLFSLIGDS